MSLEIQTLLITCSYLILLKLFLIGMSAFSASIESKSLLEWTWPLIHITKSLGKDLKLSVPWLFVQAYILS